MTLRVAIAGATGYAGGEVARLVLAHPKLRPGVLTAGQSAGQRLSEFHPHLPELASTLVEATSADVLADHEVIILALPHGQSAQLTRDLRAVGSQAVILDCGADHRLVATQEWERYYGSAASAPWTYGLPELLHAGESTPCAQRREIASAKEIAVPGCNATAVTLAIQPAAQAGLVDFSHLSAVLAVGYSGAGKAPRANLMASAALGNAQGYAIGGTHRHIPEILQNLRCAGAPNTAALSFTPVLVPMNRGILATVTAPLLGEAAQVRAAWEEAYSLGDAVKVLPAGTWPQSGSYTGAAGAGVQVTVDERAGQVIAQCALDNLGKGTAAAAIQCLNLTQGWEESLGLTMQGVSP